MHLRALALFLIFIGVSELNFAACEREISDAIDADANWARPRIEQRQRDLPGQRFQTLEERIAASRATWDRKSRDAAMRTPEEALNAFNSLSKHQIRPSSDAAADNSQRLGHQADLCLWREASRGNKGSSNQSGQSGQLNQRNDQPSGAAQQQSQQQSQQAQQAAQQNQARADQQRQGKRKTHAAAAEAHECISIDKAGSGNFGAFKNQCPYPVNFTTCNEKPRIIQGGFNWSADFDCAKQQYGLHTPKGNSSVAAHNRNTEFVYWYACKAPATPADATYTPGKGIEARCHN